MHRIERNIYIFKDMHYIGLVQGGAIVHPGRNSEAELCSISDGVFFHVQPFGKGVAMVNLSEA